jgi:hypothetical protein
VRVAFDATDSKNSCLNGFTCRPQSAVNSNNASGGGNGPFSPLNSLNSFQSLHSLSMHLGEGNDSNNNLSSNAVGGRGSSFLGGKLRKLSTCLAAQFNGLPASYFQLSIGSNLALHGSNSFTPISTTTLDNGCTQVIGDITEPLWIQSTVKEGLPWYDPDELFLLESRRFLSSTDKKVFWEMASVLFELPEISLACKGG